MSVLDLGCGTGKLTGMLHETLKCRQTLGIDSSAKMLEESKTHRCAGLEFRLKNINEISPKEKYDLIFSNASLQWIPDHFLLISRLSGFLAGGGQLAFQMPANYECPTHAIASNLAREALFKDELNGEGYHHNILTPEEYSKLLYDLGFARQIVRTQIYPHLLDSAESIIEWVKGSLLTYFESRLPRAKYELFFNAYCEKIHAFYGSRKPVFFPFKRILIWAQL